MVNFEEKCREQLSWAEEYLQTIPAYSLKDLEYSWAPLLYQSIANMECNELFGIKPVTGYLLTGPYGAGKHTAGMAIAGDLGNREQDKYNYVWVSGEEIEADPETMHARVGALFQLTEKYGKIYYMFDGLENSSMALQVMGWIADEAEKREDKVFLVVISENEELISAKLKKKLEIFHVTIPEKIERIKFFQSEFQKGVGLPMDEGINVKSLSEKTGGYNYYQLNSFVRFLRLTLKNKVPSGKLSRFYIQSMIQNKEISISFADVSKCMEYVESGKKPEVVQNTVGSDNTAGFGKAFATDSFYLDEEEDLLSKYDDKPVAEEKNSKLLNDVKSISSKKYDLLDW